MLSINIEDVIKVLNSMKPQLIGFGVVLVLAIVAMIACMKLPKAKKYMIRCQAGLAILLALVITVNLICFGPMNTMISLATGSGSISEETGAEATDLVEDIADEGIVLLKNEGSTLPLTAGSLNVFGWASTNPVYGGTGSGALNDAYHTVTSVSYTHLHHGVLAGSGGGNEPRHGHCDHWRSGLCHPAYSVCGSGAV